MIKKKKKFQNMSHTETIFHFNFFLAIFQTISTVEVLSFQQECSHELQRVSSDFLVIGHAGGDPVNYCENTLEATAAAIDSYHRTTVHRTREHLYHGANAIEIDLAISRDGVIFLWHDNYPKDQEAMLRRFGFGIPGKCRPHFGEDKLSHEMNFEHIRSVWGWDDGKGGRVSITTLNEWLWNFAHRKEIKVIWLDLKVKRARKVLHKFAQILKQTLDQFQHLLIGTKFLFSISGDSKKDVILMKNHFFQEGFDASLIVEDEVSINFGLGKLPFPPPVPTSLSYCHTAASLGFPRIPFNSLAGYRSSVHTSIEQQQDIFKKSGHFVDFYAWTIDDPKQLVYLIKSGVNGIITNYPLRLGRILIYMTESSKKIRTHDSYQDDAAHLT